MARRYTAHSSFWLEQHCADEARDGRLVGEDPDHIKCCLISPPTGFVSSNSLEISAQ
jgi:hypothetical protein